MKRKYGGTVSSRTIADRLGTRFEDLRLSASRVTARVAVRREKPSVSVRKIVQLSTKRSGSERKYSTSLNEEWKKRIINKLKYLDPQGYKCYQYPMFCTIPRELPLLHEALVQSIISKRKQIYGLASSFRHLAEKIMSKKEENPAIQLSEFYIALVDILENFYRTRPQTIIYYYNGAIRDARTSLKLLKQAIEHGATKWSRKYCSSDGCITASEPVKVNGQCIKYELIAMKLPDYFIKWYTSKYGSLPKDIFAVVIPTYSRDCRR